MHQLELFETSIVDMDLLRRIKFFLNEVKIRSRKIVKKEKNINKMLLIYENINVIDKHRCISISDYKKKMTLKAEIDKNYNQLYNHNRWIDTYNEFIEKYYRLVNQNIKAVNYL